MTIPKEILEVAAKAGIAAWNKAEPDRQAGASHIASHVDSTQAALEAAAPWLRAQALEDAADELVWKRPEKSPCESFEACCGSEASCDAMQRSSYAVGEHWLRARAVTERGEGCDQPFIGPRPKPVLYRPVDENSSLAYVLDEELYWNVVPDHERAEAVQVMLDALNVWIKEKIDT